MISLDRASYQVQPRYAEYVGLSTDVKPVESVDNGDEFQEIDTGFVYKFDKTNSEWVKQPTGGGGGTGTNDYNDLINLPQINGVELIGNKTSAELGLTDDVELIFDYIVEGEAVALVDVTKDMNEKPFRFRKIYIFVDLATAQDLGEGTGQIFLYVGGIVATRLIIFNISQSYISKKAFNGFFFGMDGFMIGRVSGYDANQNKNDGINGIPQIRFQCSNPENLQFQSGTVFKIYGEGRIE